MNKKLQAVCVEQKTCEVKVACLFYLTGWLDYFAVHELNDFCIRYSTFFKNYYGLFDYTKTSLLAVRSFYE